MKIGVLNTEEILQLFLVQICSLLWGLVTSDGVDVRGWNGYEIEKRQSRHPGIVAWIFLWHTTLVTPKYMHLIPMDPFSEG